VVSIGVSGGLDPALKPGDLVIGDKVVAGAGGEWESDVSLLSAAARAELKITPTTGAVFGSDIVIDDVGTKAVLHAGHQCVAVDMESHGAARAATEAGVPFIAIRAVADPADRALPKSALNAVAPDGSTRMLATLGAALRDPQQFPALMKLGGDSEAALKTLRRDLGAIFGRFFVVADRSAP
jgi:nucleoside phosphorylase